MRRYQGIITAAYLPLGAELMIFQNYTHKTRRLPQLSKCNHLILMIFQSNYVTIWGKNRQTWKARNRSQGSCWRDDCGRTVGSCSV